LVPAWWEFGLGVGGVRPPVAGSRLQWTGARLAGGSVVCVAASAILAVAFVLLVVTGTSPRSAVAHGGSWGVPARGAGLVGSASGSTGLPLAVRGAISVALGRDDTGYWIRERSGGLDARNAAQHLQVVFDGSGAVVRAGGSRLRLALRAVGFGRSLRALARVPAVSRANRVLYARRGIREWYANGPAGIEQGVVLQRPPVSSGSGSLTLSVAHSVDLRAVLARDARTVLFEDRSGRAVLRYGGLMVDDARGRALPSWFSLRGTAVLLHVAAQGVRYPVRIDPIVQNAELVADAGAGTFEGIAVSVAMSDSTIAVGDQQANGFGGVVYVFSKPASGSWVDATQTAELTASDGTGSDNLGYSVAISGTTIVAGAPLHTVNNNGDQGAVYVFSEPAAGGWVNATQTAELTAGDGAANDRLGDAVAASGTTVVAGAPDRTVSGHSNDGAVYVFDQPGGGGWVNATQNAELTISDGIANEQLAFDGHPGLAVSDTTIVVGDSQHAVAGHESQGAVYVFAKPAAGGWVNTTQTAELTAGDGAADDLLGNSVALSGSTIAAGAPRHVRSGNDQGAVYVFTQPASGPWANATQAAELTASDGGGIDLLGYSVAISGTTIVAGAPQHTVSVNAQGALYLFEQPAGGGYVDAAAPASLTASDAAAIDWLGYDIAASGDTILAWAPKIRSPTTTGAAYVFGPPSTLPPTLTVSLSGTGAGTVTGPGISCPGTCSSSYPDGTSVTLTAIPSAGSTFAGWSGGGCSGTGGCQVPMSSNQNVTATFNHAAGPSAIGQLTISPTPVYSNLTAACGGAAWSAADVATQWLLDGLPIPGATSTTFAPPIRDDGHQLSCSQTASAAGASTTATSTAVIVYERPPVAAANAPCGDTTGALCVSTASTNGLGTAYPHNGDWWTAQTIECDSGGWTSANGDSQLAAIRGLLEAHTVRISLERVNGTKTTVLVSQEVSDLGTARDPLEVYLSPSSANIVFSYGPQTLVPAESVKDAGLPDPGVPGQGLFFYYSGLGRIFQLSYTLTAADLGTHMRCVAGADDGPVAHPTSGGSSTDFVVSNDPRCAPRFLNSGKLGGPIFTLGAGVACIQAIGQLQLAAAVLISVPVNAGTVALPILCTLPGGCHGTLSLVSLAPAQAATARARSGQRLGTLRISLRRHSERVLHIRLTARGRRLVRDAKHGLPVVLRLKTGTHSRTLASLRLLRKHS
jgi:FG-GAP repeat/Divergent InlB B-repeat domain